MSHSEAPHPVPVASMWPAIVALGATLMLFGVVTSFTFSAVGAVLFVWAVAGWITELRHE